jgi:hypothetical protein
MPLHLRKNQYRGVNAHLQSYFQTHGGWSSFHARYIVYLGDHLSERLPPGYLVDVEKSLQIKEYHPDTGERLRRPEPDLTIYQRSPSDKIFTTSPMSEATMVQPILETLDFNEDLYEVALVVYEVMDDSALGRPVTRIEVLSPTNKAGGDGYTQYLEKRYMTLKTGLCLVEIDFLHETRSPIKGLPRYPHQADSHPYNITISNPSPSLDTGLAVTFGFDVDQEVPAIAIPLSGQMSKELQFGDVYHQTYNTHEAYSVRADYEQLPERFEMYSLADQERIRTVMQRAAENPIL